MLLLVSRSSATWIVGADVGSGLATPLEGPGTSGVGATEIACASSRRPETAMGHATAARSAAVLARSTVSSTGIVRRRGGSMRASSSASRRGDAPSVRARSVPLCSLSSEVGKRGSRWLMHESYEPTTARR
jgi:hypothetical protein